MKEILAIIAVFALIAVGTVALGLLYAWVGLDATLEGDATIYDPEPIEHCSLPPKCQP